MKHLQQLLYIFLVFSLSPLAAQAKGANYTAHEWGTFTSLIGSDGKTVDGMYHEDEPLPNFVHGFGELVGSPIFQPDPQDPCRHSKIPCDFLNQNVVTQKMETPVIYFYNNDSSALRVNVDVKFPEGMVTETYPGPTYTFPDRNTTPAVLANGHTVFNVDVFPLGQERPVPYVEPGNIYGHARAVNSSFVRSNRETEKFIFYRGAGRFQPELKIDSVLGSLHVHGHSQLPPMILLDVNAQGDLRAYDLAQFADGFEVIVEAEKINALRDHSGVFARNMMDRKMAFSHLVQTLIQAGLNHDEAYAMVNTWEHGYFNVPGLRILYILPSHELHKILPVTLNPSPTDFIRVFVGRLEVMLDTDENALIGNVSRQGQLLDVAQLGRFAESMLRRAYEVYLSRGDLTGTNPVVVQSFEVLIQRAKSLGLGNLN